MYLIFTFREFKSIRKGKTAILHLCFGTEKNRRLDSKKARYNRAFRKNIFFVSTLWRRCFIRSARFRARRHAHGRRNSHRLFLCFATAFSNLSARTNKKSRRQKAVGIFGADGEIRTLAAVTHPTPLAGAPRHQLEYICKTVNLNTHCQVVAPIRCLTNIPKRSKKVNIKFI